MATVYLDNLDVLAHTRPATGHVAVKQASDPSWPLRKFRGLRIVRFLFYHTTSRRDASANSVRVAVVTEQSSVMVIDSARTQRTDGRARLSISLDEAVAPCSFQCAAHSTLATAEVCMMQTMATTRARGTTWPSS
jgi:hypothetical protein